MNRYSPENSKTVVQVLVWFTSSISENSNELHGGRPVWTTKLLTQEPSITVLAFYDFRERLRFRIV